MAYDIPATTMSLLAGSSVGAPDYKKFGGNLTTGGISEDKNRVNALNYSDQEAFGAGDLSGAMRQQSNIMFKPKVIPGMNPIISSTPGVSWDNRSGSDYRYKGFPPMVSGGTADASISGTTARRSSGSGDDEVKAIDYTNTDPNYWKKIASTRASEVWVPNLEKKGGAEETGAAAKVYIGRASGSNWGAARSSPKTTAITTGSKPRSGAPPQRTSSEKRRMWESDR